MVLNHRNSQLSTHYHLIGNAAAHCIHFLVVGVSQIVDCYFFLTRKMAIFNKSTLVDQVENRHQSFHHHTLINETFVFPTATSFTLLGIFNNCCCTAFGLSVLIMKSKSLLISLNNGSFLQMNIDRYNLMYLYNQ